MLYRYALFGTPDAYFHGMKIAIPYWQGRVSPVFDESREILLVDIENGRERRRITMKLRSSNPLARAGDVADSGVEWLICGAISISLERALAAKNVKVFSYTRGSVKEVIDAFVQGNLADPIYLMPGCRRKGHPLIHP